MGGVQIIFSKCKGKLDTIALFRGLVEGSCGIFYATIATSKAAIFPFRNKLKNCTQLERSPGIFGLLLLLVGSACKH